MRNNTTLFIIIPILSAAFAPVTTNALAQSDQELRQENQRLRTENEDLRRELEAARQAIERLQKQVEALELVIARFGGQSGTGTGTTGTGGPATPPPVSIDETKPDASPRALEKAIKASYDEALNEVPLGNTGSRERAAHNRALDRWVSGINREMRMPIEWIVTLERAQRIRGGYELLLQAIDPKHDTELGDPFVVSITDMQARRMSAMSLGDRLSLKGTMTAAVRINAERESSGPFNNPPLIGPFVEFGFGVDVANLLLAPKEDDSSDDDAGSSR